MARRNQSVFDVIVDMTAAFPWWVGVVLAATSYLLLGWYVGTTVPGFSGKPVSDAASGQLLRAFATAGLYFLPFVFLLGAAVSAFKARKRRVLHDQIEHSGNHQSLEQMSWREFEQLVGEHFRRQGFGVEENGGSGADGGVDLVLSRGSDRYFVQCKQWKARQVGVQIIRELYGVMAAQGAAGGYVVTSGVFTDEARRFAEGREVKLIGGDQLFGMIRDAQSAPAPSRGNREGSAAPACPQCGSTMVLRTARKGSNAGSSFWGCSTFPRCKSTRPA